jgi:prevent-host-death family protein
MKTMTAAEAKNSFGKFLDMAQREPVLITKNDRPVGVFLSLADLEDTIWAKRVRELHRLGGASRSKEEAGK